MGIMNKYMQQNLKTYVFLRKIDGISLLIEAITIILTENYTVHGFLEYICIHVSQFEYLWSTISINFSHLNVFLV